MDLSRLEKYKQKAKKKRSDTENKWKSDIIDEDVQPAYTGTDLIMLRPKNLAIESDNRKIGSWDDPDAEEAPKAEVDEIQKDVVDISLDDDILREAETKWTAFLEESSQNKKPKEKISNKNRFLQEDPLLHVKRKRPEDQENLEFDFQPNRFEIKPGLWWDGVDRSNGFEKRYFEHANRARPREDTTRQ